MTRARYGSSPAPQSHGPRVSARAPLAHVGVCCPRISLLYYTGMSVQLKHLESLDAGVDVVLLLLRRRLERLQLGAQCRHLALDCPQLGLLFLVPLDE